MSDFWRQNVEPDEHERQRWFHMAADEMQGQGATFFRFSVHPDIDGLCLVEGWRARPDDQGGQQWALETTDDR